MAIETASIEVFDQIRQAAVSKIVGGDSNFENPAMGSDGSWQQSATYIAEAGEDRTDLLVVNIKNPTVRIGLGRFALQDDQLEIVDDVTLIKFFHLLHTQGQPNVPKAKAERIAELLSGNEMSLITDSSPPGYLELLHARGRLITEMYFVEQRAEREERLAS